MKFNVPFLGMRTMAHGESQLSTLNEMQGPFVITKTRVGDLAHGDKVAISDPHQSAIVKTILTLDGNVDCRSHVYEDILEVILAVDNNQVTHGHFF